LQGNLAQGGKHSSVGAAHTWQRIIGKITEAGSRLAGEAVLSMDAGLSH